MEPGECGVPVRLPEMAYLGANEVIGELRGNREEPAIRYDCDPGDLPVVVSNKAEMRKEAPEILPAGKGFRLDKQPLQIAARLDVRIDFRGETFEILRLKRAFRRYDEYPFSREKFMSQHGLTSEPIKRELQSPTQSIEKRNQSISAPTPPVGRQPDPARFCEAKAQLSACRARAEASKDFMIARANE